MSELTNVLGEWKIVLKKGRVERIENLSLATIKKIRLLRMCY